MKIEVDTEQFNQIEKAINKAEKNTSAEIFAVLAEKSDDYRFIGYAFFGFWIFLISLLMGFWFDFGMEGWAFEPLLIYQFVGLQLLAFISGVILIRSFPKIGAMIAPVYICHQRAHNNAVNQFFAHGIHNTEGRTGALIFVSLDERYAEIIVDKAIEEKFGHDVFIEQIQKLTELCAKDQIALGYVQTIEFLENLLSESFPPEDKHLNELENKLVII